MGKKFKSIPDKIKVGSTIYTIEYVDEEHMEKHVGKTLWRKGKIWIADDIDEETTQITLLHEILHCIHEITHFSDDLPDNNDDYGIEEAIVSRLDMMLFEVLKENNLYFGDKK